MSQFSWSLRYLDVSHLLISLYILQLDTFSAYLVLSKVDCVKRRRRNLIPANVGFYSLLIFLFTILLYGLMIFIKVGCMHLNTAKTTLGTFSERCFRHSNKGNHNCHLLWLLLLYLLPIACFVFMPISYRKHKNSQQILQE